MQELLLIAVGAAFVNNVVLSQFLGICPFLGVSKNVKTAAGMGGAVVFVITIASFVTGLIYKFILGNPKILGGELQYLNTIVFILVIAALVQFVEMFLKKVMPPLYNALGVYLPLITTNCAVLGVALTNVQNGYYEKGVVIGKVGKNFAAGMSGGVAYVLDENNDLYRKTNKSLVSTEELSNKYDVLELKGMIEDHVKYTNSVKGKEILDNFEEYLPKFKKIIPYDYKKMLETIAKMEQKGLNPEQAQIEAFYAATR